MEDVKRDFVIPGEAFLAFLASGGRVTMDEFIALDPESKNNLAMASHKFRAHERMVLLKEIVQLFSASKKDTAPSSVPEAVGSVLDGMEKQA